MISIAMTTYNGSKYIVEQLDSIKQQTLLPDEVIICDDRSSDNTVDIVSDYIIKNKLTKWKIFVNEKNLGWKQNFRRAISLTKGEIVFFSDQDDIWIEDKIEVMTSLMNKYNMGCLFGESVKIDGDGKDLAERNSVNRFTGALTRIDFSPSFYTVGGLGCCMCVHRRVIDKYLQLDVTIDDHDSQCPRIAVLYDSLWHIDKEVIKYRIYSGNTSGISNRYSYGSSDLKHRIADIESIKTWLEVILKDSQVEESKRWQIKRAYYLQEKRLKYLSGVSGSVFLLFRDYKYYPGLTMLIGDFAYRHGINQLLGKIRWNMDKRKGKTFQ